MPTVDVFNIQGEKVSQIELSAEVFGCEVKPHLFHDAVVWQQANKRAALASTKSRSEVSGGGRKPKKQKGTGGARAGTTRSPLWRGGSVIFGPNGRLYDQKLPKKVRKAALRSALSMKVNENVFKVIDKMELSEIKTKLFVKAIDALEMEGSLVVLGNLDKDISLASRNCAKGKVLDVRGLNVYDILKYKGLVLDLDAVKYIEERLSA